MICGDLVEREVDDDTRRVVAAEREADEVVGIDPLGDELGQRLALAR